FWLDDSFYTTIFNKILNVTILANVDINVILDTNSGSVSNSIAYMVVVAAVGIAEIIMSTVPISGSTLRIHTNKAATTGAIIIFNVTEEMTTCQLSFSPVIDPSCMPSIIIMTGIAASPTIDKVEWIASRSDE